MARESQLFTAFLSISLNKVRSGNQEPKVVKEGNVFMVIISRVRSYSKEFGRVPMNFTKFVESLVIRYIIHTAKS